MAVREAAAGYVRLLVRVPEAYWLVRDYKVSRPGVLILDGAGRRVGTASLAGADLPALGEALAAELQRAETAEPVAEPWPPTVTLMLGVPAGLSDEQREAVAAFARGVAGVHRAEWRDGALHVIAARLWVDPQALVAGAKLLGVTLTPDGHRRAVVKVTEVRDTAATLRDVMAIERKQPAILSASPDEARDEIRVLYRADRIDLTAVRAAVTAAGFTLRDE